MLTVAILAEVLGQFLMFKKNSNCVHFFAVVISFLLLLFLKLDVY